MGEVVWEEISERCPSHFSVAAVVVVAAVPAEAAAKPSWNTTAAISGSGSTGWKRNWSRCGRSGAFSGSGG